jgi:dihydrofolate synthase/folylpolyglutamate synthase
MKAYDEVLAWLYGLEAAKGMDFKLERVELALASLGLPHRGYPCIHIAGTNGKGSVAAMCHAVLQAAGYRTALYTSPHLVRFTERIRVGDEEIAPEQVVDLTREIRAAATSRGIDLTFFELVTVLAFLHFARQQVEAAVIEVGLGGRLDATNVVDPLVSVITTIGLDHQQYLGSTLPAIAAEKGGILKRGRPAVFGRLRPSAEAVLREMASARECRVFRLGENFDVARGDEGIYRGWGWRLEGLRWPLQGEHQRDNAAVALAALEATATTLPMTPDEVRAGLEQTRWPGRLESVAGTPEILLDGAHNPDGIEALVREVRRVAAGRRVRLLFAVMRDKDWSAMVRDVVEVADDVTVTSVLPPRGEDPARLVAAFEAHCPTRAIADAKAAFESLVAASGSGDLVVVAGSLFLVGEVYPVLARLRPSSTLQGIAQAG